MDLFPQKMTVADGHCDTVHLFNGKKELYRFNRQNSVGHIDLPRLKKGGVSLQCFAVCVEQAYKPCGALRRTLMLFEHFNSVMGENKDDIRIITSIGDLQESMAQGKIGALLTVEGGEALEGELSVLHSLYRLGMRGLGLTWNDRNALADGVGVGEAAGGLTGFGREVVSEMNSLGIMVDASHLSPRSYYDVLEFSTAPVVVSHANAAGICRHRRNLDDSQLAALRDTGGIIGLSFYPPFVTEEGPATLDRLLDHYCYIADRFGTSILAIGSDYDGIEETVAGLEDASCLPALAAGLLNRGFTPGETEQIMGGNFIRVLGQILSVPEE